MSGGAGGAGRCGMLNVAILTGGKNGERVEKMGNVQSENLEFFVNISETKQNREI